MPEVLTRYPDIIKKLLERMETNKGIVSKPIDSLAEYKLINTNATDVTNVSQVGGFLNINNIMWLSLIILVVFISIGLGVYLTTNRKKVNDQENN